jgi:uncharacterized iron-regulated protein
MANGYKWVAPTRLLTLAILLVVSIAAQAQIRPLIDWQSDLYLDHPLVGRIWSTADGSFISPGELTDRLVSARYIILGEKHDNADHHILQGNVLDYLLAAGKVDRVAFEMMDESVTEQLLELPARTGLDAAALKAWLRWDEEGWNWDFYGPLLQAVYASATPMVAANISQDSVGRIYGDKNAVEVSGILAEQARQQLTADIDESHCGLLPESQFPAMVRVQQARDLAMAEALGLPAAGKLSVLVAGNYHARQDLGVPNYLLAGDDSIERHQILSLSFTEVQPEEADPRAYQEGFSRQPAFDYLWFTPALTSTDYCASLQQ